MTESPRYDKLTALMADRYSCREYEPTPVTDSEIRAVIEGARLAPSAVNRQPWTFVVLRTPEERQRAIDAYSHRPFLRQAPAIIVAVGLHDEAWHRGADGKDHTDIDVAIATEHVCLAATALGLATCWVCNFDPDILRSRLELPDNAEPVVIIPLGRPASGEVPEKTRKPLDQIIRWGKF